MFTKEAKISESPTCLEGRVAIVTGAARGLGRAMALALRDAGAAVVFLDVEGAERAVHENDGPHDKALGLKCDITQQQDCEQAVVSTIAAFGAVHILVNNAEKGMLHVEEASHCTTTVPFWEADSNAWQQVIETNVNGTYLMSRAAAPALIQAGWGRIINITTGVGMMQRAHHSPYGVSKAAIEAETLIWAKDLAGTGVTVNSLMPGAAVDTDFLSPRVRASGRNILQPEVMTPPLLWLASTQSDGVTGNRYIDNLWELGIPVDAAAQRAWQPPAILAPPEEMAS